MAINFLNSASNLLSIAVENTVSLNVFKGKQQVLTSKSLQLLWITATYWKRATLLLQIPSGTRQRFERKFIIGINIVMRGLSGISKFLFYKFILLRVDREIYGREAQLLTRFSRESLTAQGSFAAEDSSSFCQAFLAALKSDYQSR